MIKNKTINNQEHEQEQQKHTHRQSRKHIWDGLDEDPLDNSNKPEE